jgi:hypothetical protein
LETDTTEEEDFDFLEEDGADGAGRGGGAEPLGEAEVEGRTAGDAFEAEAARLAEGVGEVTDCDTQRTSMTAELGGSAELVELLAGAESIVLLSRQVMIGAAAAWGETCGGGTRRRKRWISA